MGERIKPNSDNIGGNKEFLGGSKSEGCYWENYRDKRPIYLHSGLSHILIPKNRVDMQDFLVNLIHRYYGPTKLAIVQYKELEPDQEMALEQEVKLLTDEELEIRIKERLDTLWQTAPRGGLTWE
jgi:hypothetical protein